MKENQTLVDLLQVCNEKMAIIQTELNKSQIELEDMFKSKEVSLSKEEDSSFYMN